jgi:ribosomal protein S1
VVEVDDRGQRRYCQLSNADVDYSRFIPDMTRRFKIGTRVQGAITTDFAGTTRYTLLADRINPWRGLVADYPPGTTFAGRVVHTREDLGAFVTVANGVNGLIPAEPSRRSKLAAGVEVEAEIVRVDDINRRVSLELRRVLQAPRLKMTTSATMSPNKWPVSGEKVTGVVARIVRLQDGGGYLLMRLDGYERGPLAMLHHTAMTKALREDLNVGRIDSDEELDLEVINVDPQRGRISVKDLPGAASGQADQPPPLAA